MMQRAVAALALRTVGCRYCERTFRTKQSRTFNSANINRSSFGNPATRFVGAMLRCCEGVTPQRCFCFSICVREEQFFSHNPLVFVILFSWIFSKEAEYVRLLEVPARQAPLYRLTMRGALRAAAVSAIVALAGEFITSAFSPSDDETQTSSSQHASQRATACIVDRFANGCSFCRLQRLDAQMVALAMEYARRMIFAPASGSGQGRTAHCACASSALRGLTTPPTPTASQSALTRACAIA